MTLRAADVHSLVSSTRPPPSPERQQKHLELLVLLCVVEHINAVAARVAANPRAGQLMYVQKLIERVQSQLCRPEPAWEQTAILDALRVRLKLFRHEVGSAESLPKLIERQCAWLAHIEKRRANREQGRQLPEPRWFHTHWYDPDAAVPDDDDAPDSSARKPLSLTVECLEPFAVAREYLQSVLEIEDPLIDHDLQLFIRFVFRLSYRQLYVPLAALCVKLNELYYGVASFTFRASIDARPPLVDADELLRVLSEELPAFSRKFGESMDYCFRICSGRSEAEASRTYLSLYKHPYVTPSAGKSYVPFRVTPDGGIEIERK